MSMNCGRESCLRCGGRMQLVKREKIQLGQAGWFLGALPNLAAGAMEVDIWFCTGCGKIELYAAEEKEAGLIQVSCPKCGMRHDFDDPKCPHCGHRYIK